MAGVTDINSAATQCLQGSYGQVLFLLKDSFFNRRNQLLWGSSVDEQSKLIELPAQKIVHFYRLPLIQESATAELLKAVQSEVSSEIVGLQTEQCFNVGLQSEISSEKHGVLRWLLSETYEPESFGTESFLVKKKKEGLNTVIVEVGPRLSFTTAWSANAVSICRACGLAEVMRMERSRRYLLYTKGVLQEDQINAFSAMVHDRMTECAYTQKLTSFETSVVPEEVRFVPVMEKGRKALEEINQEMGLAFDEQDLQYYAWLFKEDIKRNPTTGELFDIAQSNSEHSRHCFFTGNIVIDGRPMDRTLMQIVKSTLQANPNNSVIGFNDNSSAIKGFSANVRPPAPSIPPTCGLEPWDVTMSDLLRGAISLHEFRGVVFVGGFSYADVLDSAKGWSASIRFNEPLLNQLQDFYKRPDTFSLGVCNGCQLMALLGWVPGPQVGGVLGAGGDPSQPRFVHNESGRFECRFTSVTIQDSPAIMFKGMEGSTLGVWAAHGEGRVYFPDDGVLDRVVHSDLAPVRYCDDDGNPTETYPFNVNGSPLGVAAICSPDGRHLAMMPHPERCFMMWQFPWYPKHWDVDSKGPSPWLKMFQNAREWCS